MRYSLEPNYRKYMKGYGSSSFARQFGDKYGGKLMDSATKTGKDFAKTASKRVIQETSEATEDLTGNKIADKITSIGKLKNKKEKDEIKEVEETQEIYIPPEKRKQIINDLRLFQYLINMEYQKITKLLGSTSDKIPRFITKNG